MLAVPCSIVQLLNTLVRFVLPTEVMGEIKTHPPYLPIATHKNELPSAIDVLLRLVSSKHGQTDDQATYNSTKKT